MKFAPIGSQGIIQRIVSLNDSQKGLTIQVAGEELVAIFGNDAQMDEAHHDFAEEMVEVSLSPTSERCLQRPRQVPQPEPSIFLGRVDRSRDGYTCTEWLWTKAPHAEAAAKTFRRHLGLSEETVTVDNEYFDSPPVALHSVTGVLTLEDTLRLLPEIVAIPQPRKKSVKKSGKKKL